MLLSKAQEMDASHAIEGILDKHQQEMLVEMFFQNCTVAMIFLWRFSTLGGAPLFCASWVFGEHDVVAMLAMSEKWRNEHASSNPSLLF